MKKYDFVFEGGGGKGIAHVGVIRALEELNIEVGRTIGTSAGSIVVLLLSTGYTASEIDIILSEKTPNGKSVFETFLVYTCPTTFNKRALERKFIDWLSSALNSGPKWLRELTAKAIFKIGISANFHCPMYSLIETKGVFSGEPLVEWIQKLLEEKHLDKNINFRDHFATTGKDISIVASDTDQTGYAEQLVLNHRTSPDLPVAHAVRMSISLPFVFKPVSWKPHWGKYDHRNKDHNEIVDGGLLSNFPLEIFIKEHLRINGSWEDRNPIGVVLDTSSAIPGYEPTQKEIKESCIETTIKSSVILSFLVKILDTCLSNDAMTMFGNLEKIIKLPVGGCETLEFSPNEAKKKAMIEAAYNVTLEFFNK